MKELNLNELSIEQKIGQLLVVRGYLDEQDKAEIYEMIKEKKVGGVQVPCGSESAEEIKRIKELADYPILICSDMESGFPIGKCKIPSIMALATLNDEEIAYQFGCATAIEAKKEGYNTVWAPNVDMVMGNARCRVTRTFGSDPHYVAKMTAAILRGYTDNGMFATMKHFPGGRDITVDTHMEEGLSWLTEEDILKTDILPYLAGMKEGTLSGVMTKHVVYPNIDPEYPASLSKKLISILRNAGYDGLIKTDSFAMMGILNKYSEDKVYGIAINAGIDMILPNYRVPFRQSYEYLLNCYKEGMFTEERVNEAVERVIRAQRVTMKPASYDEVPEYIKAAIKKVNEEGICVIKDDDVPFVLEAGKKRLFVMLTENLYDNSSFEVREWAEASDGNDEKIKKQVEKIKAEFPDDKVLTINVYPHRKQIENVCFESTKVDEVVFITFNEGGAYAGTEDLSDKIINLMIAIKDKLSTIIHFGNPYAAAATPHFKRVILNFGPVNLDPALSVLTGKKEITGKLPIDIKFN